MSIVPRALGIVALVATATVGTVSCGPAKPVLIYVPPSLTIDTTVRSARRPPTVNSGSHTFWEAMASLDTAFISKQPVSETQRDFAKALGLAMLGRHEDAALALDGVRATAVDSTIITASRILLTAMLQYGDNWKLLAELDSMARSGLKPGDPTDKAGVESWASAFRRVPTRQMTFPKQPAITPLLLSASGVPMMEVTINGKKHIFWLDTGSSMSIVSSEVAQESGMKPLNPDTLEVVTTTGRVPAQAGAIDRLDLAGIEVRHTTALIVANERMQVRVGEVAGSPAFVQIDGVIGYDIISRLDLRIDYANGRVTMSKPQSNVALPATGRNLFWVGMPVVRIVTSKGVPLHFNLDTGAQETYSTDALVVKTKARTVIGERRLIGGLAGITVVRGRFVDELRADMGGEPIVLRKLLVFAPAFSSFVSLDGILGSDVGKGGVVRIDATNGVFLVERSQGGRPLRGKS